MISVYVKCNNKCKPVLVAEFHSQDYADVLVNAGNEIYDDGRVFYTESDDEVTADDEIDFRSLHMTPTQIQANDAGVDGGYFK